MEHADAWIPTLIETEQGPSGLEKLAVLIEYIFRVVEGVTRDILHAKIRALGASAEELTRTIAEELHAEGRAKGIAEGVAKGIAEGVATGVAEGGAKGRLDTLHRLLVLKFGALDAASEARLQAASSDEIDRYLERLLVADSLAAVLAD